MSTHQSHRRMVFIAAIVFFIASTYFCATRLYNSSFVRKALAQHKNNKKPPQGDDAEKVINIFLTDADFPMSYGSYARPNIDGLTLMASLPPQHIPTPQNRKRLVIVGDIHGMDAALDALLAKVHFDASTDHLIATGDMINKGPNSPAVVSRLMQLGASAVRGNHEDRVLLSLDEAEAESGVSKSLSSLAAHNHRGESDFLTTGRSLSKEHVAWLRSLPVILAIEPLRLFVVHAGLVPGIVPERQDPWAVMNMRTLVYPREQIRKKTKPNHKRSDSTTPGVTTPETNSTSTSTSTKNETEQQKQQQQQHQQQPPPPQLIIEDGNHTPLSILLQDAYSDRDVAVPIESHDGDKWAPAWNTYQKRLQEQYRHVVIYGHDAKRGYQEETYSVGLDSGCVKGGALTALILEGNDGDGYMQSTVQVECKAP